MARRATGEQKLDVILRDGDRYWPDRDAFEVDVWRFESCLADAKRAADAQDTAAETRALAAAAEAYGGELLEGAGPSTSWRGTLQTLTSTPIQRRRRCS
jgi:hypothetical protein